MSLMLEDFELRMFGQKTATTLLSKLR